MKKITAILALLLITGVTFAQRSNQKMQQQKYVLGVITNTPTWDTTVNVDTSYNWYNTTLGFNVNIQYTNTKISGTPGGAITVWGSMDNSTWYQVQPDTTTYASPKTKTVADGTTSDLLILSKFQFAYVRVRIITSGTQSSALRSYIWQWSPYTLPLN